MGFNASLDEFSDEQVSTGLKNALRAIFSYLEQQHPQTSPNNNN